MPILWTNLPDMPGIRRFDFGLVSPPGSILPRTLRLSLDGWTLEAHPVTTNHVMVDRELRKIDVYFEQNTTHRLFSGVCLLPDKQRVKSILCLWAHANRMAIIHPSRYDALHDLIRSVDQILEPLRREQGEQSLEEEFFRRGR